MPADATTQLIYDRAAPDLVNSWLRELAAIRRAPETWPTRWPSKS